jgi:hypothetical protein
MNSSVKLLAAFHGLLAVSAMLRRSDASTRNVAIAAIITLGLLKFTNPAAAQTIDAPFGFTWSQSKKLLPDASSVIVDGNITRLTYRDSKLPPQIADADAVVLRLCDGRGLQQVRWLGRAYPLFDATSNFLDLYEEIMQRSGQADQYDPDHATAAWTGQQRRMRLEDDENRNYHIVVIYDGPQYADCRAEHAKIAARQ